MENLKALRISSLDDDPEEQEEESFAPRQQQQYDDDMGDSEEDELTERVPVTLGFVEKPKNEWTLLRQLFPSKAGGVPGWLDPVNFPSGKSSLCGFCRQPLQFLLQVYAPITEKESTFHRTLFVFMCPSMSCLLKDQHEQWKCHSGQTPRSVKVFRSQLPHTNPFYSSEAPKYNGSDKPSGAGAVLCTWCGTWKGDKVCSSCKRARYCSETHQISHWRSGHKIDCQKAFISSEFDSSLNHAESTSMKTHKVASKTLWPEYEIYCEDESESDAETEIYQDCTHAGSLVSSDQVDRPFKSSYGSFLGDGDKKSSASFQVAIAKATEQVLRYCRNERATPLWSMSTGMPSKDDIPKCNSCGGLRTFEFQILPQLLYFFGVKNEVDSLDWGTIVVYTCEASCDSNLTYRDEFAWVQLSSPSTAIP